MTGAVVELDRVCKRYGAEEVVSQVSLNLDRGERVALIGHNGAGKTSLMKMMLGVVTPTAGRVRVLGEDPTSGRTARVRREVGFLPENANFDDALTGTEALRFYARLKRRPLDEVPALLERVGLTAAASRRVRTYSKGMRQRLGLAQALLGRPRLLLLDEPTTGLDPALRAVFYDILADLAGNGAAILLSSHILSELEERTDRIVIMDQGRALAAGGLDALRKEAGLPVRLHLVAAPGRAASVSERLAALGARLAGGDRIEMDVAPDSKLTALRAVLALGPDVRDLSVEEPGLSAVYEHHVGRVGVPPQRRAAE